MTRNRFMPTAIFMLFMLWCLWPWAASGADLKCRKDIWGHVSCAVDGRPDEIKVRENFWGEKEILENGKLVSRCKENIWGDLVCTAR